MEPDFDPQTLYDLRETARALQQIISDCGGPEYNNPNRLDLTALERTLREINQVTEIEK